MSEGADRFALLVRCNPKMWAWWEEIPPDGTEADIDWTCRLKPGSVEPGTPVFVLGTGGSGFMAKGFTVSDIRDTEGGKTRNSWTEGNKHRAGSARRICLRLRRASLSGNDLRDSQFDYLIRRQSTFTWLSKGEALGLENLIG